MKKAASILVAAAMAATLAGCSADSQTDVAGTSGQQSEQQENKQDTKEMAAAGLTVEYPATWGYKAASSLNSFYLTPPCGGTLYASVVKQESTITKELADSQVEMFTTEFFKGVEKTAGIDIDIDSMTRSDSGDAIAYTAPMTSTIEGIALKGMARVAYINDHVASVICGIPVDADAKYFAEVENVFDGILFEYDESAVFAEKKAEQKQEPVAKPEQSAKHEPSASSATTSQINALRSAGGYLRVGGFSHQGLIEQLEYEGFSNEDATYAADNCGADWNMQAAKSAEMYMKVKGYSRSELIEQLEYEGFTAEQAAYGADSVGL